MVSRELDSGSDAANEVAIRDLKDFPVVLNVRSRAVMVLRNSWEG
jgi:hypothetical protein